MASMTLTSRVETRSERTIPRLRLLISVYHVRSAEDDYHDGCLVSETEGSIWDAVEALWGLRLAPFRYDDYAFDGTEIGISDVRYHCDDGRGEYREVVEISLPNGHLVDGRLMRWLAGQAGIC